MSNVLKYKVNKKEYILFFQNFIFNNNDFEDFYKTKKGEIEFLPGIYYKIEYKQSFLLKVILKILAKRI